MTNMTTKNDIPVSPRQLLYLALLLLIPLALAIALVAWAPPKPGHGASDTALAVGIVGAIFVTFLGILFAAARRRAIEITADTLLVRHSLYTFVIKRSEVASATVREVSSVNQLGLSSKKNGIAAFGYFSGLFRGAHGDLMFCALSSWPVYLVKFEGTAKCRQLALSADLEIARNIEAWAKA